MLTARFEDLATLNRPLLLTEFMARPMNSTFATNLPVLRRFGAWGYAWGLVQGRMQTEQARGKTLAKI